MKNTAKDWIHGLTMLVAATGLIVALKGQIYPNQSIVVQELSVADRVSSVTHASLRALPNAAVLRLSSPHYESRFTNIDIEAHFDSASIEFDHQVFIGIIGGKPYMGIISSDRKFFYPVQLRDPVPVGSESFPHPVYGKK